MSCTPSKVWGKVWVFAQTYVFGLRLQAFSGNTWGTFLNQHGNAKWTTDILVYAFADAAMLGNRCRDDAVM